MKEKHHRHDNGMLLLAGNRGVGKTALLNRLAGAGPPEPEPRGGASRIAALKGSGRLLLDTTGICSMLSRDAAESAARDGILRRFLDSAIAGIIFVADARNMVRSLALALQYAEFGLPMVLAVNHVSEAAKLGIDINQEALAEALGIPVLLLTGPDGGIDALRKLAARLPGLPPPRRQVAFPLPVEHFFSIVGKLIPEAAPFPRLLGLFLLSNEQGARRLLPAHLGGAMSAQLQGMAAECLRECALPFDMLFERRFHLKARQIAQHCRRLRRVGKSAFRAAATDICTRPLTGVPIACLAVGLLYLFVGSFGAGHLAGAIHNRFFQGLLLPLLDRIVATVPSAFVRSMLMDPDFGIVPNGVGLAVGLVLPVIFCFYLSFGLLEDSGYLPRLSVLLDRTLQRIGLNGRGVVPLALGFSCVTSAILTTRTLGSEKERNIASFLLFLGFPCAPLIAVMFVILGNMPASASVTVFGLIAVQVLGLGVLANRVLPGRRMPLLMELPPLRAPRPGLVFAAALRKTFSFTREAVPVFLLASFCIFLFNWCGGLAKLEHLAAPLLGSLMGLPETSMQVFIKTMIRRESGAAELAHLSAGYDNLQLVVNLLVMTLIAPCVNASIVLFKERGTRTAMAIVGAVTLYAIVAGSVVNHACRFLGITFS